MIEIIRMPRMSDTMEEGVIVEWHKKVGDKVEPGDILAEVETDKATMELESFYDGYLLHIGIESGPVPVDGIIAVIGDKDEDYKEALAKEKDTPSKSDAKKEDKQEEKEEDKSEDKPDKNGTSDKKEVSKEEKESDKDKDENGDGDEDDNERVKASPLAKSMAKEAGIDLSNISGSGDHGRIVKKDIEALIEKGESKVDSSPSKTTLPSVSIEEKYEDVPLSQMRKTIARRLGESKFTAPHFYLTIEVDMEASIAARVHINEMEDVKVSFNDFVVKAAAMALRKHPAVNSSWLGDKIRYNQHIHMGIAVAVDEGLLVPVVKNADFKSLSQLNAEIKELAVKARDRKLKPEEMQGNTFTISNLGMFDIDEFTAIINPPDACILAIGSISEKPVIKNGMIVPGNIMKVTMSCDHRVVDGVTGAKFLQTFKQYMEAPVRMIV